jgi:hypothetical protein
MTETTTLTPAKYCSEGLISPEHTFPGPIFGVPISRERTWAEQICQVRIYAIGADRDPSSGRGSVKHVNGLFAAAN